MAVEEAPKRDGKYLPEFHWHHQYYPAGFYTDADALAAWGKKEDKRKFVTEPREQKEAANKKRWGSSKTWGKAMTNVFSLDEDSWTAMIEKGETGLLEDADKTTDVEWAIQLTLLAAIVIGAKAGAKAGESRGGRANTERVSAEEIRAEAREQGIDLPDDTGFQMRLNELAREFNTMPEEQRGRTLRDINKGNVNKAQVEYNEAKTPIDRLRAKKRLDRVKKELAKYEGEYMKKGDIALKGKSGYEGEGGGFLDIIDEEAGEKEPLLEKEKPKKESGTKGLLDLTGKLNKKGGSLLDKLREQGEEKKRQEADKEPIKSDKLENELEDGDEGNFEGDELKEEPKPQPPDLIEKSKNKGKGKSKINPQGEEGTGGSGKPKIVPEIDERAEKERIEKSLYSRSWEEMAQERELNAQRGRNAFAESWESQKAREMGREAFEKGRNDYMQKQLREKPELEDEDILDLDFDEDLDQPFDRDEQNKFKYENEEVDKDFDENLDGEEGEGEVEEMNLEEELFEETDPLLGEEDRIEKDKFKKEFPSGGGASVSTAAALLASLTLASTNAEWNEMDSLEEETTSSTLTNVSNSSAGNVTNNNDYHIKNQLNTLNIDELLRKTLTLSKLVYDDSLIGTETLYNISSVDSKIVDTTQYTREIEGVKILFNYEGGILYVAFRGSANISNWLANAIDSFKPIREVRLFKEITDLSIENDIEVHEGFIDKLAAIYELVREEIDKFRNSASLVLTGHSLGGALASLFYFCYNSDQNKTDGKGSNIKLKISHAITFGAPRFLINEKRFVDNYNARCPNLIRVFNYDDPIPYMPNYLSSNNVPTLVRAPILWSMMAAKLAGVSNDAMPAIILSTLKFYQYQYGITTTILGNLKKDISSILSNTGKILYGNTEPINKDKIFENIIENTYKKLRTVIHVGQPLCLNNNIAFNNVNNLVEVISRKGQNVLKEIESSMNPTSLQQNEIFQLITSKEFRANLTNGTIKCIPNVTKYNLENDYYNHDDKDILNKPQYLAKYILNNIEKIENYTDKCDFLKPLGLDEYFKWAKIGQTPTQQNFALSTLPGMMYNKQVIKAHYIDDYEINLSNLVNTEINTRSSFFNYKDSSGSMYNEKPPVKTTRNDGNNRKETETENEILFNTENTTFNDLYRLEQDRQDLLIEKHNISTLPPIVGIFIGDYNNYEFIEY